MPKNLNQPRKWVAHGSAQARIRNSESDANQPAAAGRGWKRSCAARQCVQPAKDTSGAAALQCQLSAESHFAKQLAKSTPSGMTAAMFPQQRGVNFQYVNAPVLGPHQIDVRNSIPAQRFHEAGDNAVHSRIIDGLDRRETAEATITRERYIRHRRQYLAVSTTDAAAEILPVDCGLNKVVVQRRHPGQVLSQLARRLDRNDSAAAISASWLEQNGIRHAICNAALRTRQARQRRNKQTDAFCQGSQKHLIFGDIKVARSREWHKLPVLRQSLAISNRPFHCAQGDRKEQRLFRCCEGVASTARRPTSTANRRSLHGDIFEKTATTYPARN